ncbi:MAG: 50S ribosomal protein L6 [Candidatus Micrarchaeaceae archaeon]
MSTEKKSRQEPVAELDIPEGVSVSINGTAISVKGALGSNERVFNGALVMIQAKEGKITIEPIKDKDLKAKAMKVVKSLRKEMENDISGVNKYFEKRMKIVFAHFPISVEAKGDMFYINNIIGERVPRISRIVGSTKIEAKGQNVRIYGTSLDDVAQTAANIRIACKIRNKDSRVFQDGLYYDIE